MQRAAASGPPREGPAVGAARPLRVVHVLATLEIGGAERQVALLAEGLRARGHEVSVLALTRGGPVEDALRAAGVDVEVLHKRGKVDPGALVRLARALARRAPDVVHAHMFTAAVYAAAALPLAGIAIRRLVLTQHGRPPWEVTGPARGPRGALLRALYRPFDAALARLPVPITCPTAALARAARRRGVPGARLVVVPNAIDVAAIADRADRLRARGGDEGSGGNDGRGGREGDGADEANGANGANGADVAGGAHAAAAGRASRASAPSGHATTTTSPPGLRVVTVGRLDPIKRVPWLVEAVALLRAQRVDARLAIVGDGADRDAVLRAAVARGLAPRSLAEASVITLAGEQRDVIPWLAAADVFALASRSEGLPLAVLEAMAAGLPVVAAAIAGLDEPIADGTTGVLVRRADPARLASNLFALAASPSRRAEMAAAARRRVEERFGIARVLERWLALYEVAAGRRSGRAVAGPSGGGRLALGGRDPVS